MQDLEHIDRVTYAGTTLIGKLGVESAYERALHGKNGYREILVNAQGRSEQREGAFTPNCTRRPRSPAMTWCCRSTLRPSRLRKTRSAITAAPWSRSIPTNGDVLALASKPGFDPAAVRPRPVAY